MARRGFSGQLDRIKQQQEHESLKNNINIKEDNINSKKEIVDKCSSENIESNKIDLGVDMKAKVESKNVTISMKESIHSVISAKAKENKGKSSTIVKNILLKLYNKNTKNFEFPIEPKVVDKQKGMSVNMPVDMIEAIEAISKETNKSKSEIVEELVSRYLESVMQ